MPSSSHYGVHTVVRIHDHPDRSLNGSLCVVDSLSRFSDEVSVELPGPVYKTVERRQVWSVFEATDDYPNMPPMPPSVMTAFRKSLVREEFKAGKDMVEQEEEFCKKHRLVSVGGMKRFHPVGSWRWIYNCKVRPQYNGSLCRISDITPDSHRPGVGVAAAMVYDEQGAGYALARGMLRAESLWDVECTEPPEQCVEDWVRKSGKGGSDGSVGAKERVVERVLEMMKEQAERVAAGDAKNSEIMGNMEAAVANGGRGTEGGSWSYGGPAEEAANQGGSQGSQIWSSISSCTSCQKKKGSGRAGVLLKLCPCGEAKYCSKKCQLEDWKKHKKRCRKALAEMKG